MPEAKGKVNVYICPFGHRTVTRNMDEGGDALHDRLPDLQGGGHRPPRSAGFRYPMAESSFYRVDQFLAHSHEWYRPETTARISIPDTAEHVRNGGPASARAPRNRQTGDLTMGSKPRSRKTPTPRPPRTDRPPTRSRPSPTNDRRPRAYISEEVLDVPHVCRVLRVPRRRTIARPPRSGYRPPSTSPYPGQPSTASMASGLCRSAAGGSARAPGRRHRSSASSLMRSASVPKSPPRPDLILKDQYDVAYLALADIRDAGRDGPIGQTDASKRAQAALDKIAELTPPDTSESNGGPA